MKWVLSALCTAVNLLLLLFLIRRQSLCMSLIDVNHVIPHYHIMVGVYEFTGLDYWTGLLDHGLDYWTH